MKPISLVVAALILAVSGVAGAATAPGTMTGSEAYSLPDWFKPSFLDFRSDVAEARKQGKHVMAFVHLDECPYCARMLKENFVRGENRDFMQKHFDVVAVNVRGSLEVKWIDGATYTERALTRHLGIIGTPTLVFLDLEGNKALQLSGYRDPRALRHALEYMQSQSYRRQPFTVYLAGREQPPVYALRDHPQFSSATNFKGYKKPLALLFEDRNCADCARFHDTTLNHPDVVAEMTKFRFVRLDARSDQVIIDLDGRTTTPAQWAKALDLSYRPAVALFDEGRLILRLDGRLYHFHFKETLRYVSGGYYKRYETISAYNVARREELLKRGIDINYAE